MVVTRAANKALSERMLLRRCFPCPCCILFIVPVTFLVVGLALNSARIGRQVVIDSERRDFDLLMTCGLATVAG